MSFVVDLRIDIRTKKLLNITLSQKNCVISFVSSIVKFICYNATALLKIIS